MTDHGAPRSTPKRRPSLARTTLGLAAVAFAAAALIWSALFYQASREQADASAPATVGSAPTDDTGQPAPLTTRTS